MNWRRTVANCRSDTALKVPVCDSATVATVPYRTVNCRCRSGPAQNPVRNFPRTFPRPALFG
jgi:hypothetical protein